MPSRVKAKELPLNVDPTHKVQHLLALRAKRDEAEQAYKQAMREVMSDETFMSHMEIEIGPDGSERRMVKTSAGNAVIREESTYEYDIIKLAEMVPPQVIIRFSRIVHKDLMDYLENKWLPPTDQVSVEVVKQCQTVKPKSAWLDIRAKG